MSVCNEALLMSWFGVNELRRQRLVQKLVWNGMYGKFGSAYV